MHQLQRSWLRSQHPSAQWNLRGGRWSSVKYSTNNKNEKNPPKNILKRKFCGSGFAWIRINLAVLDSNSYWECKSGFRNTENSQNLQKRKPWFSDFQKGVCTHRNSTFFHLIVWLGSGSALKPMRIHNNALHYFLFSLLLPRIGYM